MSRNHLTSTDIIGRLARTKFFNHFSNFDFNKFICNQQLTSSYQRIHCNLPMNSLGFYNEFTRIP